MNRAMPPAVDAATLSALRSDMLRVAQLQLRDAHAAEDVVQDAIEAALLNAAAFAGRSTVRAWIFAILRNKIVDYVHQRNRSIAVSALVGEGEDSERKLDELFNDQGRWTPECRPSRWPEPDETMSSKQFWRAFEACLGVMPEKAAEVFMLREYLGWETSEICSKLDLSQSNVHVILHRARLRLRECLESGWLRHDET